MVEMLGVLAIVGVLSIGAISGYTYAMSKHRANEILNGISLMAISASQQIALRRDFSLAEFKDEGASSLYINGSYPVTDEKYDDGTFELTVSGVPKDACDRLVSMDWKQPKEILVNDGAGCQKGDSNVLAFTFYDDLDDQGKDQSDVPADDDDTSDNTETSDASDETVDCSQAEFFNDYGNRGCLINGQVTNPPRRKMPLRLRKSICRRFVRNTHRL